MRDGAAPYATIVTDENGIADTSYNPRPDDQHGALPYDDYLVIETGQRAVLIVRSRVDVYKRQACRSAFVGQSGSTGHGVDRA